MHSARVVAHGVHKRCDFRDRRVLDIRLRAQHECERVSVLLPRVEPEAELIHCRLQRHPVVHLGQEAVAACVIARRGPARGGEFCWMSRAMRQL